MPSEMRKDGSERGRMGYLEEMSKEVCTGDPESCWACSGTCKFESTSTNHSDTDE
jgi:hypothetical protein